MTMAEVCPYRPVQTVIYRPSAKGWDCRLPDQRLEPGKEYVVREIVKDVYVVVEGYNSVGGGLFWSEFIAVEKR
jgi:hypothetical protein